MRSNTITTTTWKPIIILKGLKQSLTFKIVFGVHSVVNETDLNLELNRILHIFCILLQKLYIVFLFVSNL